MKRHVVVLAMALAAVGCDDGAEAVLDVTVDGVLFLDPTSGHHLVGRIVVDLALPEGAEPVDLVLDRVSLAHWPMEAAAIDGLEDFPSHLEPGEARRVVLGVERPPSIEDMVSDCGTSYLGTIPVSIGLTTIAAAGEVEGVHLLQRSADVIPELVEPPAPVAVAPVLTFPQGGVAVAFDPSRDDELLAVTHDGRVQRIAPDGTVRSSWSSSGYGLAAARGGGVDAFLLEGTEDLVCAGVDDAGAVLGRAVGRVEGGELAWCAYATWDGPPLLAVDGGGVVTVVAAALDDPGSCAVRSFSADGDLLSSILIPFTARSMAVADGGIVVLAGERPPGLPPPGAIAVVGGDGARLVDLSPGVHVQSLTAHEGTRVRALLHDGAWTEVDLETGALEPLLEGERGSFTTAAPLHGDGALLAGFRLGWDSSQLGVQLAVDEGAGLVWRDTLSCAGWVERDPVLHPGPGSSRFLVFDEIVGPPADPSGITPPGRTTVLRIDPLR